MRTPSEMTCSFLIQLVFCKKKTMWFIGVEVEQETSAPPPKKNPGSAPGATFPSIAFREDASSVERTKPWEEVEKTTGVASQLLHGPCFLGSFVPASTKIVTLIARNSLRKQPLLLALRR